ncbi:MAG: Uma2 family endonuclease [Isosphaeraceae bacterium]
MAAIAELETPVVEVATPPKPQDEALFEVVDGRWVEKPTMSYFAGIVSTALSIDLGIYIRQQVPRPGRLAAETLFRIPLAGGGSRKRRPDFAFVSAERWPLDRPMIPRADAWDVVPDLAVEVVSPTDIAQNLLGKVQEYFQAGVRLVWVVYPLQRCIHVFDAWNRIRVLGESDSLDGGVVLPGFQRALDDLFGPVAAEDGNGQHD